MHSAVLRTGQWSYDLRLLFSFFIYEYFCLELFDSQILVWAQYKIHVKYHILQTRLTGSNDPYVGIVM